MDLKVISGHNQAAYLAPPPEKHKKLYTSLIKGLNSCRIVHALRDNPVIYASLVQDFWKTASFIEQGADGKGSIEATIQKKKVIVTEQIIREVLRFNDNETDPTELPAGTVEAILPRLSYEGNYPSLLKKLVHPYWRLLMHMFMMCMTENRGGTDQLSITQSAAFVCLITNQAYNYSRYVFDGMKRNVLGVRKDKFVMYPRFLQMIFDARYSELERTGDTLDLKPMGPFCFGALMPKKSTAVKFVGRLPFEKFGQFAETEEDVVEPVVAQSEAAPVEVNAVIAEEHDVQIIEAERADTEVHDIDSDIEEILVDYDGDDDELPPEAEVSVAVSADVPPPVITAERLALILKTVSQGTGNPPSDPSLQPTKRRKKDPRPGIFVEPVEDQPMVDDDLGLYDFDFETNPVATESMFDVEATTVTIDTSVEPDVTTTEANLAFNYIRERSK